METDPGDFEGRISWAASKIVAICDNKYTAIDAFEWIQTLCVWTLHETNANRRQGYWAMHASLVALIDCNKKDLEGGL